jgi:hypothetical protein
VSLPRLALLLAVVALPLHVPVSAGAQTPAQEPKCQMKVVSCNYAYLYSGQFSWTNTINGSASQFREQVTVGVKNGVADCSGTVRETSNGQTTSGTVSGPGLFAVEFERDSANKLVYRITAACPTAAGMGSPVHPAELGHHDQQTYEQRATMIGQKTLQGSSNYPAPETDSVNGVTGTVQVTWNITRP